MYRNISHILKQLAMAAAATTTTLPLTAVSLTRADDKELGVIEKTRAKLPAITVRTGEDIKALTMGFRGKKGEAVAAVEPSSLRELYELITLYKELGIGYLLQGANTALKGQGTPTGGDRPVVIIRTAKLKGFKVLDFPGSEEYKVILVQPGLALKEMEPLLNELGFDLPHKIGSHALGNTFGGSAATGCGGVRVDNRSGEPSTTHLGSLGAITMGAEGMIWNGIFPRVNSGSELLEKMDAGTFEASEVAVPHLDETVKFIQRLYDPRSYPITNHLNDNPFSGQGYEGTQAIMQLMYLVRRKPTAIASYVVLLPNPKLKEDLYRDVIFKKGPRYPDALPILCESMSAELVSEIVSTGTTYVIPTFLALAPPKIAQYFVTLLSLRKHVMSLFPSVYPVLESSAGKVLSHVLTPTDIRTGGFGEMLILQVADRVGTPNNVLEFNERLDDFVREHPLAIRVLKISPGSLEERLILQIRNVAAIATVAISAREQGSLFAFDDAIMPGKMTEQYCKLFSEKLAAAFPGIIIRKYLYGHDLKQISHNDWVLSFVDKERKLSPADIHKIYALQHATMLEVGGVPHAEHGIGDHADTDLDRTNLVKLVAHRLLNDPEGLANPGGGFEKAFQKAIGDPSIVEDALRFAHAALQRESERGALLTYSGKPDLKEMQARLDFNATFFARKLSIKAEPEARQLSVRSG
jgi:D-lactate dehydrogenase